MPRDGLNQYHRPPGTDAVTNYTIESTKYNAYVADVEQDLNTPRPIVAGGTGATSGPAALVNLGGEQAMQGPVTNYDTFPFVAGSFWSPSTATSAPTAARYSGICTVVNDGTGDMTLEAQNPGSPTAKFRRRKLAGVWQAWEALPSAIVDLDAAYVNVTGDTMTGNLTINQAVNNPAIFALSSSGTGVNAIIGARNAGQQRWAMYLGNQAAETGGNVGSDFGLNRIDDAGTTVLGTALTINRASGRADFGGNLSLGFSGASGALYFGSTLTKSLSYDGTNFNFSGGTVYLPALVSNGTIYSGASAATVGAYYFGNNSTKYLNFDGTNFNLAGGDLLVTSNIGANGHKCRPGAGAAFGANVFNIMHGTGQQLWIDNTNVGTFAYTSDYRIKKDVIDLPGMWDTVKKLRPIKYTQAQFSPPSHIKYVAEEALKAREEAEKNPEAKPREVNTAPLYPADDIERWGFIAHELQEVMIESAASGVKDSPDTIQSPNPFTVIAALTRALQEAMARIEALEARTAQPK